ncbi:DUF3224 domain-containing protein [Thermocrispum municipale]|uniref:DUF3224 domain-containing protein n=1 Tax=Thermocrispum municipale TaxID=37926 RepID=UPI00041C2E06|nr:DUF3224 domain-containing protein [Thermocrispum municipale]
MADNTFTTQSWDERAVSGTEGSPRVAHAHATFAYTGLIEGTSTADMLLYYADDSDVTSPGLERFEGSVAGRKGTFVVRHEYRFAPDSHEVTSTFSVLPGSATGELTGLTGRGTIAGSSRTMKYTFEPVFG